MSTAPPWCQRENVKKKTWILGIVLTLLFRLLEIVSDTIFWLIHYNAKPQVLPPITNGLLLESGTSLAEKIRNQKVNMIILFFKVITVTNMSHFIRSPVKKLSRFLYQELRK